MMRILRVVVSLMLLLVLTQPTHATVYSLVQQEGLPGDYGYSGTVTTDGSIGSFSDASVISDWDIELLTPGENDGITSQNLVSSNSTANFSGPGTLDISATAITLSLSMLPTESSRLTFDAIGADESLSFFSSKPPLPLVIPLSFQPGLAYVTDMSEPQVLGGVFLNFLKDSSQTIIVATVIPEPSVLNLCWFAMVILRVTKTRSSR